MMVVSRSARQVVCKYHTMKLAFNRHYSGHADE